MSPVIGLTNNPEINLTCVIEVSQPCPSVIFAFQKNYSTCSFTYLFLCLVLFPIQHVVLHAYPVTLLGENVSEFLNLLSRFSSHDLKWVVLEAGFIQCQLESTDEDYWLRRTKYLGPRGKSILLGPV